MRLRVRELAEARGWNMSQLQKLTSLTMPTIRRYWYNTADGKAGSDKPLLEINIVALEAFARVFGISARDLIAPDDVEASSEGNSRPMRNAAKKRLPWAGGRQRACCWLTPPKHAARTKYQRSLAKISAEIFTRNIR